MRKSNAGIGLIEVMVAMVLGLVVTLGVIQIFLSAKNTYQSQNSAAVMQEDARYFLSRITQEIRMTGMFGCLLAKTDQSTGLSFTTAASNPITYTNTSTGGKVLTLITADIGSANVVPDWTILTDCATTATVISGAPTTSTALMKFPVRRATYTYLNGTLYSGIGANRQALVNNVSDFGITFGIESGTSREIGLYTAAPTAAQNILSVRLSLTLTDAQVPKRVRDQTYNVVATIRNKVN